MPRTGGHAPHPSPSKPYLATPRRSRVHADPRRAPLLAALNRCHMQVCCGATTAHTANLASGGHHRHPPPPASAANRPALGPASSANVCLHGRRPTTAAAQEAEQHYPGGRARGNARGFAPVRGESVAIICTRTGGGGWHLRSEGDDADGDEGGQGGDAGKHSHLRARALHIPNRHASAVLPLPAPRAPPPRRRRGCLRAGKAAAPRHALRPRRHARPHGNTAATAAAARAPPPRRTPWAARCPIWRHIRRPLWWLFDGVISRQESTPWPRSHHGCHLERLPSL